jgi:putative ABC transport system ATP-binding protein
MPCLMGIAVRKSMTKPKEEKISAAELSQPQVEKFLRLSNLSKGYIEGKQRRLVLDKTSVTIYKGEFVAILGRSGSGKTTLLNLISGIDVADEGEIYLNGWNLSALNDMKRTLYRRQNIGFIFQFFNLIPTLTVWENIALPLELNGKLDKEGVQRGEQLLGAVGLLDRRNAFPDLLSGGEQQRVAIARALVHNPSLVLADEPTGNLDEERGRQVLELIDGLTRSSGKNLILVTHNPEAASYADRVLFLQDGKLEEQPRLSS